MKHINKLLFTAALLCWGSAALATSEPIPGIDVIVRKTPGGVAAKVLPNRDGTFQFSNLPPGHYDLCITGQPCKAVAVGKDGALKGIVGPSDNKWMPPNIGKGIVGPTDNKFYPPNIGVTGAKP